MTQTGDLRDDPLLPFYDDLHFPSGFARSGYFSQQEAEILLRSGRRLSELWKGIHPETELEVEFVKFCQGLKEADNQYEKAWANYLETINRIDKELR